MIEALKEALRTHKVYINFTKVDGTHRTMLGTLDPSLIPPAVEGTSKREQPRNPNLIKVYDVETPGWRCFYADSLASYEIAD